VIANRPAASAAARAVGGVRGVSFMPGAEVG